MSRVSPQLLLVVVFLSIAVAAFAIHQPPEGPGVAPGDPPVTDSEFTHRIVSETPYYTTGPQQGRPPEGTLSVGTPVVLVNDAGSYVLVRTAEGVVAYVSADSVAPRGSITPAEITDDVRDAARAGNEFAVDLYQQLRQDEGNLFFSPASISTALAMTWAGARGETAAEMARTLHLDPDDEGIHQALGTIGRIMNSGGPRQPYTLRMANRLWGQDSYPFRPEFLATTRSQYGAELAPVDFQQNTEQARQAINRWIAEQTAGKISELFPRGALDSMTRLALTNAVYFKGTWKEEFRPSRTEELPFHVSAGREVNVPMMQQTEDFRCFEDDQVQVLELPYKGGDLAMVVVLPKALDGLAAVEEGLSLETLEGWLDALGTREVILDFPRYRLETTAALVPTLQALGMTAPFTDQADFSGISTAEELYLSAVIHKAYVDVNEEGTEAAAATGVAVGATAFFPEEQPMVFTADHPFLFLIRDSRTGAILFLGRVVDPRG